MILAGPVLELSTTGSFSLSRPQLARPFLDRSQLTWFRYSIELVHSECKVSVLHGLHGLDLIGLPVRHTIAVHMITKLIPKTNAVGDKDGLHYR